MADQFEYECALSGVTEEGGMSFADDGLGDCPPGWVQVTMKRRLINPKYMAIQQTKENLVALSMQQIPDNVPDEVKQVQRTMMEIQVEAQFHAVEAETPPFLTYEEKVFIAPPETNSDLLEAFNEVREGIGLEALDGALFTADEDDDDDEGDEDSSDSASEGGDEMDELDAD
jgi:hypothetical protein